MQPKCAFGKLISLPPIEPAGTIAKVHDASLALQGHKHVAMHTAFGVHLMGLRNYRDDVARFSVLLAPCHNDPDRALINLLLQLGQRTGLTPAKSWPKVTQPAEQIIGALLSMV